MSLPQSSAPAPGVARLLGEMSVLGNSAGREWSRPAFHNALHEWRLSGTLTSIRGQQLLASDPDARRFPISVPNPALPKSTDRHLSTGRFRLNGLFWMTLSHRRCKSTRTENPRVGGSIPPLATIQIRKLVEVSGRAS